MNNKHRQELAQSLAALITNNPVINQVTERSLDPLTECLVFGIVIRLCVWSDEGDRAVIFQIDEDFNIEITGVDAPESFDVKSLRSQARFLDKAGRVIDTLEDCVTTKKHLARCVEKQLARCVENGSWDWETL